MTAALAPILRPPRHVENDWLSMTQLYILTRDLRFMLPWKHRMGACTAKPELKFAIASDESVPPAPWVNIRTGVGVELSESSPFFVSSGHESVHWIGLGE